mgnify:CR=1 FL=1
MDSKSFDRAYAARQSQAEAALRRIMKKRRGEPSLLYEAMEYSLFAGGKRFRPVLMLSAHALGQKTDDRILDFASAIEMIHTYSLIHDDLPAMDDDDFRRGKPTCHRVYGEAMAVLAGDGLLNLAFEIMADAAADTPDAKGTGAMAAVAKAAGGMGMIGGQTADMEGMALPTEGELLTFIHYRKTGALLRASLEAGMILSGTGEDALGSIREYGDALGMVYQIRDDLLDTQGSAEMLGKPVGSDERNDKKTFVTVYGKEKAQTLLTEWLKRALASLAPFGEDGKFLRDMVRYAAARNH